MSGRIRKLDAELYQNNRFVKNRHVPKFAIPAEFKTGHNVRNPYQDPTILVKYKQACPICGKAISVTDLKRNILEQNSFEPDCRITYTGCNPLWYEVISCPYCYYTNHYLKFFGINNFEYELVESLIKKEHAPIVEARLDKRSDFDWLVIRYLQAIHINEHINPDANALIGGMWRNLYWMSKDAADKEFAVYCAEKAAEKYRVAVDQNQFFDTAEKCTTALSLASMLAYLGEAKDIRHYVEIAMESPEERIQKTATQVKARLERMLKR